MPIDRHYHWTFIAYNQEDVLQEASKDMPDKVKNIVSVSVIGYIDERDAMAAARLILERDKFFLHQVYECSRCGFEIGMAKSFEKLTEK